MIENSDRINLLLVKLENLLQRQESFSKEICDLRDDINKLKAADENRIVSEKLVVEPEKSIPEADSKVTRENPIEVNQSQGIQPERIPSPVTARPSTPEESIGNNLEKFIGENLINKIGIVITIIGVAIGAKYSIEHQLISPLTRIILGYLMGIGLLGIGIRLKKQYENFSAVLVSGAMAIVYFITFFAYSFYGLIPQGLAFLLMVLITSATVYAALNYNKQVIAHIGLVGAYTVPFLLSDGSGKVAILYSYMAIINIGILVIAFKKYWKLLYYASFVLTWLIFVSWFASKYQFSLHYELASTFLAVFFAIFYSIFLAYKLIQKETFDIQDILLLLTNSFIFYGVGYAILDDHETGKHLLGLYTICNAVIHSVVGLIIYRQKQSDRNLFYVVSGLVLVFITIAIPVQLKGNWVTLLWVGEAALLFWIGRAKALNTYEIFSYPLMVLAFVSILMDWTTAYSSYSLNQPELRFIPLFNVNFLSSLIFIASFGFINVVDQKKNYSSSLKDKNELIDIVSYIIPIIFIFTLYNSFRLEIANYWDQLFADSALTIEGDIVQNFSNYDLLKFKSIWLISYSLLFLSFLSFVNIRKLKNQQLGFVNLAINILVIVAFLTAGLYNLSVLRENYLQQTLSQYYPKTLFNIEIRYILFVFAAVLLYATHKYIKQEFLRFDLRIAFDIFLHTTLLWVASSELISWMDIVRSAESYKLGLSILWGVYSLMLISLGIWKRKRYLRVGAIILFAVTLLKLFFYDISNLDTIRKTIVFVSLGVLLLIISFLYNKYKNIITEELDE